MRRNSAPSPSSRWMRIRTPGPDDDPSRIDHGTFCYTAVREGLIDTDRSAHVGIRTVVEDNLGIAIHDAREVHATGAEAVAAGGARAGGGTHPHICRSISTGLTRPFAPGTGHAGLGRAFLGAGGAVPAGAGRDQPCRRRRGRGLAPPSIRQGSRRLPGPMSCSIRYASGAGRDAENAAVDIS